ncbi:NLP/P60 protein [Caldicellulosiruptor hydrothermalis 108]|uniref:NLP/P60 protein n=1 Tax=Caldicellulosiruptor hydrothermalis (strain DSM 18901 / VKM B-2411 / 108) TaxID=632292 RepID=E4Q7A8_CALH1|nr:C40 family peptidase [Caldicellulosiruptor hydrothermalis]ADQ06621.1 NLP/P60 protein [Caldicellulosiruptor hydrothermalis 108]
MNLRSLIAITLGIFLMFFSAKAFAQSAQAKSTINIRSAPSTSSKILGVFPKGFKTQVLSNAGGWVKISYDGIVGYVKSDYITITNEKRSAVSNTSRASVAKTAAKAAQATVLKDNARLRSDMSTSSKILKTLKSGSKVYVLSREQNGWVKVKTLDGTVGYMAYYLLKMPSQFVSKTMSRGGYERGQAETFTNLSLAQRILEFAQRFRGIRYSYGGTSPSTGFDCSGFVQFVFKNFGIHLERTAADMARTNGVRISYSEIKPGDLLFFDTDGGKNYINHVGIYLGGGKFIHASSARGRVTETDLNSYYGRFFMMAKRVIR